MPTITKTPNTAILATGNLTLQVAVTGPTEVEVTGTFGSVVLGTSTAPTVAERTITADDRFKSEMSDMLFTLTGTGPVVVSVKPIEVTRIITFILD